MRCLALLLALLLSACGPDEAPEVEVPSWAHVVPEQIAEAKKHGVPVAFENDIGMRFVLIPAGTFLMGSPEDEEGRSDDETQHEVTISQAFYAQITEVSRAQFEQLVQATGYVTVVERTGGGSTFKEPPISGSRWASGHTWRSSPPGMGEDDPMLPDLPVVFVARDDAMAFCEWRGTTLPSEEQFEFLLRADAGTSVYPWGDDPTAPPDWANLPGEELGKAYPGWSLAIVAGYRDRHRRAAPVASYRQDRYGLYDTCGNVSEWCSTPYLPYGNTVEDEFLPGGVPPGVLRGGNFFQHAHTLRCAWRRSANANSGRAWWGFRCVSPLPEPGER